MTESEWFHCADPQAMLAFLELNRKCSNRTLWLFICGCCRRHEKLMADSRCRSAVEVGERFAEGQASADELLEANEEAFCLRTDLGNDEHLHAAAKAVAFAVVDPENRDSTLPPLSVFGAIRLTSDDLIRLVELDVPDMSDQVRTESARQQVADRERSMHCRLLRCAVGNPFRPASLDPAWRTATVLNLAAAIYNDRGYDMFPILADALEEAGCTKSDILNHWRQTGVHVRGCWVVDLLLGRE